MTADLYDVIIVGAGPSGSTAGYYLGKNPDIRVLIVDRFEFPRYKSCAGGLFLCDDWPREFENFNSGLEMVSRQPCYDCDFYFDRKFIHRTYNTHLFDVVDRAEFDAALLEVALQQSNVKFKRFPVERIRYESDNGKDIYCLESA
ncbi:MAG: NAD(P)-binding protein, partial [Candidatus Omnitrophota bacterium]